MMMMLWLLPSALSDTDNHDDHVRRAGTSMANGAARSAARAVVRIAIAMPTMPMALSGIDRSGNNHRPLTMAIDASVGADAGRSANESPFKRCVPVCSSTIRACSISCGAMHMLSQPSQIGTIGGADALSPPAAVRIVRIRAVGTGADAAPAGSATVRPVVGSHASVVLARGPYTIPRHSCFWQPPVRPWMPKVMPRPSPSPLPCRATRIARIDRRCIMRSARTHTHSFTALRRVRRVRRIRRVRRRPHGPGSAGGHGGGAASTC